MNVEYPVYAAAFLDDSRLVVGGGGGEGNNGIPNKLSLLEIEGEDVSLERDLELPSDQDNPTSMAASANHLFVGMNDGAAIVRAKKTNRHLRTFNKSLEEVAAAQVFESLKDDTYQRVTTAGREILAFSSSAVPAEVVISREKTTTRITFDDEVLDMAVAPDDRHVVICCPQRVTVVSSETGKEKGAATVSSGKTSSPNAKWSRVGFIGSNKIVVAANIGKRQGSVLYVYTLPVGDGSELLSSGSCKVPRISAVTALESDSNFVAVAGTNGNLVVFESESLRVAMYRREVHKFPVTAISLNPAGNTAVTTSLDGSVHIHKLHKASGIRIPAILSILVLLLAFLWMFPSNHVSLAWRHDGAKSSLKTSDASVTSMASNIDTNDPQETSSATEFFVGSFQEAEIAPGTDQVQEYSAI